MKLYLLFLYLVIFIIGLCFGSFLNVVIYRIPRNLSLINPPSSCPSCHKRLGAAELIPLLSFIFLRGRCLGCGATISARYPAVELFCGLLFFVLFRHFGFNCSALFYLTLLYLLTAISLIDIEHQLVPNSLISAGLLAGVILQLPTLLSFWFRVNPVLLTGREPLDALLGFLAGGAVLLAVVLLSRGGMGAGDVKLIAMIGFYTGLRGVATVLLLAFLSGAVTGLVLVATGRLTRKSALPFAPFLALGALVEVFLGRQLWHWYINLFS